MTDEVIEREYVSVSCCHEYDRLQSKIELWKAAAAHNQALLSTMQNMALSTGHYTVDQGLLVEENTRLRAALKEIIVKTPLGKSYDIARQALGEDN